MNLQNLYDKIITTHILITRIGVMLRSKFKKLISEEVRTLDSHTIVHWFDRDGTK